MKYEDEVSIYSSVSEHRVKVSRHGEVATDWNFSTSSVKTTNTHTHSFDRMAEEPRQVEAGPSSQLPSGFEKWRSSLSQFTGLGLTEEQLAERESSKANGVLARDWDRCEKWKKELLERSKLMSFSSPISWPD